jgi:hypothetical protein
MVCRYDDFGRYNCVMIMELRVSVSRVRGFHFVIIDLASIGCGVHMHIRFQASHYLTSLALRYILTFARGPPRIDASIHIPARCKSRIQPRAGAKLRHPWSKGSSAKHP